MTTTHAYDVVAYYMDNPFDLDEAVKRFVTVVEAANQDEADALVEDAFMAAGISGSLLNWYARAQDETRRMLDAIEVEFPGYDADLQPSES